MGEEQLNGPNFGYVLLSAIFFLIYVRFSEKINNRLTPLVILCACTSFNGKSNWRQIELKLDIFSDEPFSAVSKPTQDCRQADVETPWRLGPRNVKSIPPLLQRIQKLADGECRGRAPTYYFSKKCMKMKEIIPKGGGGARPWSPQWIRQCFGRYHFHQLSLQAHVDHGPLRTLDHSQVYNLNNLAETFSIETLQFLSPLGFVQNP